MEYVRKYYPTTQKDLFHKDKVAYMRKWIKDIQVNFEEDSKNNFRKLLLVCGPLSCGKTTNINVLFKAFQKIYINIDDLRFNEKTSNILDSLVNIGDNTIRNVNTKIQSKTRRKNIIIIDDIELSDKNIKSFIDSVHKRYNVPIILIQNSNTSLTFNSVNTKLENCTNIEFSKVSLLELTKLILKINKNEDFGLNKNQISLIIKKSSNDLNQIFSILEFMDKTKDSNRIDEYLENVIAEKDRDIDLIEKLNYIYKNNDKDYKNCEDCYDINYDFDYLRKITETDSQTISNNIFQNYPTITTITEDTKQTKDVELSRVDIIDSLSISNILLNNIYSNQLWELYPYYVENACIIPINNLGKSINKIEEKTIIPFKDISYNYLNSFEELKKIIMENNKTKNLNFLDIESIFIIMKMIVDSIEKINNYFNKCKKGKNTSKKEKFELYNNLLKDGQHFILFNKISDIVFTYKFFEIQSININDYINQNKEINYEYLYKNIDVIDIKILKRLVNITCLHTHVLLTTNTETALKINIFENIV